MFDDYLYENTPRVIYGDGERGKVFLRVCPRCGRFVKADGAANLVDDNAACKKHGRVKMPFEGWEADLYEGARLGGEV